MPWSGRADPSGLRAGESTRADPRRQCMALARDKEEAAQERIPKGPRAAPPGTCIGHGAVASASVAYAAAGAGVGASRKTPEEPSPPGARIGHGTEASASAAYAVGVGASRETPKEPWANESLDFAQR